jgi:hypothetical protein
MGWPRKTTPTLRHHKGSGQAFILVDGQSYYLGPWDSSQAKEAYRRFLIEGPVACRHRRRSTEGSSLASLV